MLRAYQEGAWPRGPAGLRADRRRGGDGPQAGAGRLLRALGGNQGQAGGPLGVARGPEYPPGRLRPSPSRPRYRCDMASTRASISIHSRLGAKGSRGSYRLSVARNGLPLIGQVPLSEPTVLPPFWARISYVTSRGPASCTATSTLWTSARSSDWPWPAGTLAGLTAPAYRCPDTVVTIHASLRRSSVRISDHGNSLLPSRSLPSGRSITRRSVVE